MAMRRRELFQISASALAAAALGGCKDHDVPHAGALAPGSAAPVPPVAPRDDAARGSAATTLVPTGIAAPPHAELEEVAIAELAARLASGAETTRSLVTKYRARIAALDPTLHAVIALDPDADTTAARLDSERAAGKLRGPLHGIPILVKDNIDAAGKLATTAGSLALADTVAPHDSFVVAQLRAAGALILGKANLSEWANLRGMASSSGWSAVGGQCRNPYALDRSPSGSSSGSAVAVAANLCAGALGSETDGSIVSPASCNGVVGVKPTVGLVSRAGVIPISASQDTVGPLARTVADAALLLSAIAGPDPADPSTTAPHPLRPATREDYSRLLDPKALAGVRIGIPRTGYTGLSRPVDANLERALAVLTSLGAVLVDPIELEVAPEVGVAELEVMQTELKAGLAAYLATRGLPALTTVADLIAFNTAHADRELPRFGQEHFEAAQAKGDLTSAPYLAARASSLAATRDVIDKAMVEHQLDAIVAATSGTAWLIDPINGDGITPSCSTPAAVAGYPHVTVPAGAYLGLPLGLSFFGRPYSEAKLLASAFAYEQATHLRTPPRYLATAGE